MRELIVHFHNGRRCKVAVPDGAKITFGQVQPGKGNGYTYALRIYRTQGDQLAVLTNVEMFYDAVISIDEIVNLKDEMAKIATIPEDDEDDPFTISQQIRQAIDKVTATNQRHQVKATAHPRAPAPVS